MTTIAKPPVAREQLSPEQFLTRLKRPHSMEFGRLLEEAAQMGSEAQLKFVRSRLAEVGNNSRPVVLAQSTLCQAEFCAPGILDFVPQHSRVFLNMTCVVDRREHGKLFMGEGVELDVNELLAGMFVEGIKIARESMRDWPLSHLIGRVCGRVLDQYFFDPIKLGETEEAMHDRLMSTHTEARDNILKTTTFGTKETTLPLSSLKLSNLRNCFYTSVLNHNFTLFSGFSSAVCAGRVIYQEKEEGHAFNLVVKPEGLSLVDISRPLGNEPHISFLRDETALKLLKGEFVTLTLNGHETRSYKCDTLNCF